MSRDRGKKNALRLELRTRRRALSAADHRARSKQVSKLIARLPQFAAGRRVAVYLPFDRETDTAALIAAARRRMVRLYAPVVADRRHRTLRFHALGTRTRRGAFGIPVPHRPARPLPSRWFNLIVVPLVGVDVTGRRLGMGGGYYDRSLEFRRRRETWRGPLLVGMAFDCQRVDSVHADPWDLRLDAAATESGLTHYPQGPT
jgi:5-formyltetrahydrofolate cyclo-ligase